MPLLPQRIHPPNDVLIFRSLVEKRLVLFDEFGDLFFEFVVRGLFDRDLRGLFAEVFAELREAKIGGGGDLGGRRRGRREGEGSQYENRKEERNQRRTLKALSLSVFNAVNFSLSTLISTF
jgi:hypothetical protein